MKRLLILLALTACAYEPMHRHGVIVVEPACQSYVRTYVVNGEQVTEYGRTCYAPDGSPVIYIDRTERVYIPYVPRQPYFRHGRPYYHR